MIILKQGDFTMKTTVVLMLSVLSVTFAVDAEAAKKSSSKHRLKSHAVLKHKAAKKKLASKRQPAQALDLQVERLAAVSKPKRHDIVVNMTEHVNAADRAIETDPNRPLTW